MAFVHELKCHPQYFQNIWIRKKLFEIRLNDREFNIGDKLLLKEFDTNLGFSNRKISANIDYMLEDEQLGIKKGYCILSLSDIINYDCKI